MSLFDEFGQLQNTVNMLMGDFGRRSGRNRRGGGLYDDWGFDDPFGTLGWDSMDVWGGQPMMGKGQQGLLQPSEEKSGPSSSSALTTQPTQIGTRQQGGPQLPVLRCRVNVEDQKDKYLITAEVPGFDKQNLKLNISDDNVLTISGEQKKEHVDESKEKKYVRVERSFGSVQRSLRLPRNINKDQVTATYENGVLHIGVPKVEKKEAASNVQIK